MESLARGKAQSFVRIAPMREMGESSIKMSSNNVLQMVVSESAMSFEQIERLLWATQEGKIAPHELLSFGQYGLYIWRLLNNPGMTEYRNGESTGKKLRHFVVALTEQEEFNGVLYGLKTGRELTKTGKQSVSIRNDPFAVVDAFESLLGKPHGNTDNDINTWQCVWRLAYAESTGFLSHARVANYAKHLNLSTAMLAHAKAHWQTENPSMLNKSYQTAKKAATPATPVAPKNGKEKVTA